MAATQPPFHSDDEPTHASRNAGDVPGEKPAREKLASNGAAESEAAASATPAVGSSANVPDIENDATVITSPNQGAVEIVSRFSTKELGEALVGTKLQSYELMEFVGGGGMGAVFRAHDSKLERTVAVKVLARNGPNGELAKRFLNEAQSAAQLDHENIARVYNVDESGGLSYIVFEFVEGGNLRQAVEAGGPLSVKRTLQFAMQIAQALEHAAQRKIIHRDIKPSNILLTAAEKIKLVDMGLARMTKLESNDADLTASGMTLGTFDYISPEQARDPRRADIRSDLYSLGCTMYFMLTGSPPFPEGNPFEKVQSHSDGKRPDPRKTRADVGGEIANVIRKLMAPNPNARYQSPSELMTALSLTAHQLGHRLVSPGYESAVTQYEGRRRWMRATLPVLVPAMLLAIVVIGLELGVSRATGDHRLVDPQYERSVDQELPESTEPRTVAANEVGDDASRVAEPPTPTLEGVPNQDPPTGRPSDRDADESVTTPGDSLADGSGADGRGIGVDDDRGISGAATDERQTTDESNDAVVEGSGALNPAEAIRYIDVGRENRIEGSDVAFAAGLPEAIEIAAAFPNLRAIRLCFDGERLCQPLVFPAGSWIIEAAEGVRPILTFRTVDEEAVYGERNWVMIDTVAKQLEFRGVDVHWDIAAGMSVSKQSLFRIHQDADPELMDQELRLTDCTFTVRHAPILGTLVRPQLAIVEVESPSSHWITLDDALASKLPPRIRLERCAVRGSVNLVSTPVGTPYGLSWRQGLFTSDRRMIETGGLTESELQLVFGISIDLDQVLVDAERGLARAKHSVERPGSLKLTVSADQCLYITGDDASLIEHELVSEPDRHELLRLEGAEIFLPDQKPIWTIRNVLGRSNVAHLGILDAIENGWWFAHDQVYSSINLSWREPFAMLRQEHVDRTVSDYLLDPGENSLLAMAAGFDPAELREFPDFDQLAQMTPGRTGRDDPASPSLPSNADGNLGTSSNSVIDK